jgi:hypothetical protein
MEQLCGSRDCRRQRAGGRRIYRAEQGLRVCRFCCERVRDNMIELPKLYEECESDLTRFPFAFEERVSGSEVKGLCLNEASINARLDIISVLATWSAMVAEERGLTKPARRDVPDLAAFLTRHLDWLLAHSAGPYFADEVVAMTATARRASRSGPALRLSLGHCVEEDCDVIPYGRQSSWSGKGRQHWRWMASCSSMPRLRLTWEPARRPARPFPGG